MEWRRIGPASLRREMCKTSATDKRLRRQDRGAWRRWMRSAILRVWGDAEKGCITPSPPQARRDASLPELRSRVVKILNVPMAQSRSWPAQGLEGDYRYACAF